MKVEFTLNGQPVTLEDAPPPMTLLEALRQQLNLTGTRLTCGIGICGACTVLVDGEALGSCLLLAPMVAGREVITIEGLGTPDELHPIQQAYMDAMGLQCSYCTPGFVLTTLALLRENPQATDDEIKEYLAGNLCRCGSYYKILNAVHLAQARLGSPAPKP